MKLYKSKVLYATEIKLVLILTRLLYIKILLIPKTATKKIAQKTHSKNKQQGIKIVQQKIFNIKGSNMGEQRNKKSPKTY